MNQQQITAESLIQVGNPEQQKQFLGEHLYPRVQAVNNALAGRIVAMILEAYPTDQIIINLNDEATLRNTIDLAIQTIQ